MSPFPVQMEDHWAPEQGVDPDRAQLIWFMRFSHDPQVTSLVRLGQEQLAGLDGLDLVPAEWLHITTLIAGFADEIPESLPGTPAGCTVTRGCRTSRWPIATPPGPPRQ